MKDSLDEIGRFVPCASELLLEADGVDLSWIGRVVSYASELLLESDQLTVVTTSIYLAKQRQEKGGADKEPAMGLSSL